MTDLETIKNRIRKLMAVAGDGVAPEGEIDNALRLAAKLKDAHHIADADLGTIDDAKAEEMGRTFATTQGAKFSTWECTLAWAVCDLFGCVKYYSTHETAPIRVNGVAVMDGNTVRKGRRVAFYGPAIEAAEAASLFEEWARSIAAMGCLRWGGCFRGDGAMYCYGFATALREKSRQIDAERIAVQAKPLIGSTSTAITLTHRYDLLKSKAKAWLGTEFNIHLSTGSRRGGYSAGSSGALAEGRSHGSKAGFGRRAVMRALPGN